MQEYIDQMNRTIRLENTPSRIVSLVPSQTELLHHLGLDEKVVGITKFCIHPNEWFQSKTRVGGTKQVDLNKVKALKPDLIIGNKEENTKADIEALEQVAPVWMSDVNTLEQAIDMIRCVGLMTDAVQKTEVLIDQIEAGFLQLDQLDRKRPKVLYFMWRDPYYTVGKETFIDAMLRKAGFENVQTEDRYPELHGDLVCDPDYVFLSSEPFPFNESHVAEMRQRFPNANIVLVDGEMFSWYGSRLVKAANYFTKLRNQIKD